MKKDKSKKAKKVKEKENFKVSAEKYKAWHYSNQQFDKNVLFIASGALGISFAFIEKIIPDLQNAKHSCYLIDSWYCFAAVMGISLIAPFVSIMANRWAITHVNCDNYDKKARRWNYTIRGLNISMIIGLLAGIVLLIQFIKLNI